jgi:hypothetical protein
MSSGQKSILVYVRCNWDASRLPGAHWLHIQKAHSLLFNKRQSRPELATLAVLLNENWHRPRISIHTKSKVFTGDTFQISDALFLRALSPNAASKSTDVRSF